MITMITLTVACLGLAGYSWMNYRAAWNARERGRMSNLQASRARDLAEQYHEQGRLMYQQALDSFAEGQQFWAAATEALLDAKRRQRQVDDLVDDLRSRGLVSYEWKGDTAA